MRILVCMVQLAQYYDARDPRGMFASEKYDGIRALWNGRDFLTRTGHIIDVPDRFKVGMPKFEVDGELWCGYNTLPMANGMIKRGRDHEGWNHALFMAFDLPSHWGSFARRARKLAKLRETATMRIVRHFKIRKHADLLLFYTTVLDHGGEGVMLRNASASYVRERTTDLLKLKPSNQWAIDRLAA